MSTVVEVDFLARRRADEPEIPTDIRVQHTGWCQSDQCHIGADGGVVHRRLIGKVGDVKVSVERNDDYSSNWELRMSPIEVYVQGNASFGLTDEQVAILVDLLVQANTFVADLRSVSAVS